ncbi:MAG: methyltransferase family protein [Candidatus Thorarchaeota archaeon]
MLPKFIIQIFLITSFLIFGYNITYIILFKRRHKNNESDEEINNILKETRLFARIGVMLLNIFITIVCLNIFFYDTISSIIPRIDLFIYSEAIQIVGFTLVIGGNITLYLAYHELGIYWAYPIDGISKRRKLVKSGIYSYIRHPIYLSFNLFCIGFNMILLDWLLLILYIIGGIGLYFQAIDEENILLEYFGDEYRDYMKNTGRFFVKFHNK